MDEFGMNFDHCLSDSDDNNEHSVFDMYSTVLGQ